MLATTKNFTHRLLSWVPAAVHWGVAGLPGLTLAILWFAFGPLSASFSILGAAFFLYQHAFYPGNASNPRQQKAILLVKSLPRDKKKRIAVIGAGPAGVVTAKELLCKGHSVQCFDACPHIGGVFAHFFWPSGRLVSSPYITCFSDYEPTRKQDGSEHWEHHTALEYVEYLQSYADHFGVTDSISFNTKVLHVFEGEGGENWLRVHDLQTKTSRVVGPFDHVAVCSGSFHNKFIPKIPGLDSFPGKVFHSEDFATKSPGTTSMDEGFQEVSGRRVVALGLGESMADILRIITARITHPVSYCAIAVRKGAFVIPRVNPLNQKNNDFDSTRFRYSLPKLLHNWSIYLCTVLTNVFAWNQSEGKRVRFELMKKLTKSGPAFVKTTKSDDFVSSIVEGSLTLKPQIETIRGSTVYFNDGSTASNIDVLLFGTGFATPRFPFLDEASYSDLTSTCQCPSKRFLRMFHPELGAKLAFIGIGVRPLVGSIPTICELQARLFAMIVSGERDLPSVEEMAAKIGSDEAANRQEFGYHNENWKGLVNWIPFMDQAAREIGCLPPRTLILTHPMLGAKVLFGPMSPFHYRLHGPGCDFEKASNVLQRLPYGARLRDVLFYAGIHFTRSLLLWPFFLTAYCNGVLRDWTKPDSSEGKKTAFHNRLLWTKPDSSEGKKTAFHNRLLLIHFLASSLIFLCCFRQWMNSSQYLAFATYLVGAV